MAQHRKLFRRRLGYFGEIGREPKRKPGVLLHPFLSGASKDARKLRTSFAVECENRARRDDPFRPVAGILVRTPAIRPMHRDVVDLFDKRALVMVCDEDIGRRHGHDIGDADCTGSAEREPSAAFAL